MLTLECQFVGAVAASTRRTLLSLSRFRSRYTGCGQEPPWPEDRVVTLQDEVALIEPLFAVAGTPLCLVGHSYGAAVALIAALKHPSSVRAIAVYEPTLFALLEAESPGNEAVGGIRDAAADAAVAVAGQDHYAAAARFIDYWMGVGTWRGMPEARQRVVAASMANVTGWAARPL